MVYYIICEIRKSGILQGFKVFNAVEETNMNIHANNIIEFVENNKIVNISKTELKKYMKNKIKETDRIIGYYDEETKQIIEQLHLYGKTTGNDYFKLVKESGIVNIVNREIITENNDVILGVEFMFTHDRYWIDFKYANKLIIFKLLDEDKYKPKKRFILLRYNYAYKAMHNVSSASLYDTETNKVITLPEYKRIIENLSCVAKSDSRYSDVTVTKIGSRIEVLNKEIYPLLKDSYRIIGETSKNTKEDIANYCTIIYYDREENKFIGYSSNKKCEKYTHSELINLKNDRNNVIVDLERTKDGYNVIMNMDKVFIPNTDITTDDKITRIRSKLAMLGSTDLEIDTAGYLTAWNMENLTLIIPKGIIGIRNNAFKKVGIYNLDTISIPETVKNANGASFLPNTTINKIVSHSSEFNKKFKGTNLLVIEYLVNKLDVEELDNIAKYAKSIKLESGIPEYKILEAIYEELIRKHKPTNKLNKLKNKIDSKKLSVEIQVKYTNTSNFTNLLITKELGTPNTSYEAIIRIPELVDAIDSIDKLTNVIKALNSLGNIELAKKYNKIAHTLNNKLQELIKIIEDKGKLERVGNKVYMRKRGYPNTDWNFVYEYKKYRSRLISDTDIFVFVSSYCTQGPDLADALCDQFIIGNKDIKWDEIIELY